MGRNKPTFNRHNDFFEFNELNKVSHIDYLYRIMEIALSIYEWKNMPDTIDVRFLEMALFRDGKAVFFKDEELGFLTLRCMIGGTLSVYNVPNMRTAYAPNGYNRKLNQDDSVVIFNNYLRTPSVVQCLDFARKLYSIDRTIDINLNAHKTPVLITCTDKQKMTLKQLYSKYDGNEPVIYGDDKLQTQPLTCINTNAPYLCDKLFDLKNKTWNECMTYLGVPNISEQKRERLITDEVMRSQGGTIASRYSKLVARQNACKEINKMFELDIECDFRDEFKESVLNDTDELGGGNYE